MSYQPERTRLLGVDDEPTRSLSVAADTETPEQEAARLADEAHARQQERAARARALGDVPVTPEDEDLPQPPQRPDNDRFVGSVGLLLLRLVLTAYVGIRGVQIMFDVHDTSDWLTNHHVPYGDILSWVLGILLLICALMLLLGFGTRAASFIVAALTIAVLIFIRWGYSALFTSGQPGFLGETDVLVTGIALALLLLGSGGWAVDGAMRRSRAMDKHS